MSAPSVLRLVGLGKRYGTRWLFRNLNVDVAQGSLLSAVGPSGVGKTTLLRIIAGLDQDHEGTIHIAGRDVSDARPAERNVAIMFQNAVTYPHLTVKQNIEFPLRAKRVSSPIRSRRVDEIARQVHVDHILDRKARTLSGGERQRAALGRAFAAQSVIRLLDEPIKAAFEPDLRAEIRAAILEAHRSAEGITVLVTHDHEEALELADRLLVMLPDHDPVLITPRDAYFSPPNLSLARFIGGGTELRAHLGASGSHIICENGLKLHVSGSLSAPPNAAISTVLLRPRAVEVRDGTEWLVSQVSFSGPEHKVVLVSHCTSEPVTIRATLSADDKVHEGVTVGLAVRADRLLLFDQSGSFCCSGARSDA